VALLSLEWKLNVVRAGDPEALPIPMQRIPCQAIHTAVEIEKHSDSWPCKALWRQLSLFCHYRPSKTGEKAGNQVKLKMDASL
jgi:hypothetical protein